MSSPDEQQIGRPIIVYELPDTSHHRLPGRDVAISDDEDDEDAGADKLVIEIVEENKVVPRKSSFLNTNHAAPVRKRSVSFTPLDDVIADEEGSSRQPLTPPTPPATAQAKDQFRLLVNSELPQTPPPHRGAPNVNHPDQVRVRPPTPPGISHKVKPSPSHS